MSLQDPDSRTKFYIVAAAALVVLLSNISTYLAADIRSQQRDEKVQKTALKVCESLKEDRLSDARAFTKGAETWFDRGRDSQLPARNRTRSQRTAIVYAQTARELRSRLFLCKPLVEDNKEVLDAVAVREAENSLRDLRNLDR